MEDQSLFTNNQPRTVSEGLQNFIDAMVEEIVLEGKPFDTQKKYLKKFSENEGLDYDKLEADIITFIEILDSLKTAFSKLQVKLAEEKGKECHISEGMVKKLVNQSSQKNQEEKPKPVVIKEPDQIKNDDSEKPKKKKVWPWIIGLGTVAVVALLVLFQKPKQEPILTDPDTQAFEACQTVADYRAYCANYGLQAIHYDEAQHLIDSIVADSTQRAKAETQAFAIQEEENAYQLCTTIEGCDAYLEKYPQGLHLEEVQAKRDELAPKTGSFNGHEWVDLGLPSGTLWATCNVGASKPEDYGSYFVWGETSASIDDWDTYKHANGDWNKLTKYCSKSDFGNNGFTDHLTTLQSSDDAATAKWGSGWRTPSMTQMVELRNNTTNRWTTQKGIKGCLFTSKTNGQTLFLPAAGWRLSDSELRDAGSDICYWSRSLNTDDPGRAWSFSGAGQLYLSAGVIRTCGLSVRPVREK